MEYDFILGFTLFNTTGFKTRFKHFDNLKEAIMFANNVDLKDNSKIYVDLKYLQDKIEDILNSENSEAIEKLIEWQSLLEKE